MLHTGGHGLVGARPLLLRPVLPDHPGGDEMRVEDAGEAHPAARELDLDAGVRGEVETEAAVVLRDRDAEEAELLHFLDERRGVLVGVLELRGDGHDVALDELPDRRDDLPLLGASLRRAHQAGARSSAAEASGASAARRSSCSSRARRASSSASTASASSARPAFSRYFSRTSSPVIGFSGPPRWYGRSASSVRPSRVVMRTPPGKAAG